MRQLLFSILMAMTMTSCAQTMGKTYKVKITFGEGETLTATFDDNVTTRAIIQKMPMTLPMLDLYGDEMCYRFPEALPTDNVEYKLHKKGEIFYWPLSHSFVIRYIETDEWLDLQHLGQMDSGVDVLNDIGDIDMTFELIDDASGIRQPQAESVSTKAYTLTGTVASASDKGIIIRNGKKTYNCPTDARVFEKK